MVSSNKRFLTASAVAAFVMAGWLSLPGCTCGALPLPGPLSPDSGSGGDAGCNAGLVRGPDGGCIAPDACPAYDCTGRCGPIRDFCSGNTVQCGACPALDDGGSQSCNLVTNTCGPTLVTCSDLGAECGTAQNSCGTLVNCPSCSAGMECNPSTNKCVQCRNPTPAQLGFQCGMVWLGCGPQTDLVDAGTCAQGYSCNPITNACEPDCTPDAPALCAKTGAQCGLIPSGCGGANPTVNCGQSCPNNQRCNGITNRCEPAPTPTECFVANRNCGTLTSACRMDGGLAPVLNCGTCTVAGEVCNENGRCGPPCTADQCGQGGLAGKCGIAIDAGCGLVRDCGCSSPLVCSTSVRGVTGTCEAPAECSRFTDGTDGRRCSNGPSPDFPSGGGINLHCPCNGSGLCLLANDAGVATGDQTGTCCFNKNLCAPDSCQTSVVDTCTGMTISCNCDSGKYCDPMTKTCKVTGTCANLGATGVAGAPCSVSPSPSFPQNATQNLTCDCNPGGQCNVPDRPIRVSGPDAGVCCFNTQTCDPNECNTAKVNPCTGMTTNCTCTNPGTTCSNISNTCVNAAQCSTFTNGQTGSQCSNGPAFQGAAGTAPVTCSCSQQNARCYSTSGPKAELPIGSPAVGICCVPDSPPVGKCSPTTYIDTCGGPLLTAPTNCPPGQYCNNGNCLNLKTCATIPANGNVNDMCSVGPAFDSGNGTLLTCRCNLSNYTCRTRAESPGDLDGWQPVSGSQIGTCCENTGGTCGNRCNITVTDSCTGDVTSCTCGSGNFCDPNSNTCTPFLTCASYGANGSPNNACTSTGGSTRLPRGGNSGGLTCRCNGGGVCINGGGRVTGDDIGTCCLPALCGSTCNATIYDGCSGNIICGGCGSSQYCGGNNQCANFPTSCSTYGANGQSGNPCSKGSNSGFARYPGDPVGATCGCANGSDCYTSNGIIVSGSATGNCCTPTSSSGRGQGAQCGSNVSNGCGGSVTATCAAGLYCNNGTCQTQLTCASYGANGSPNSTCSNGPSFDSGGGTVNLACGCGSGLVCARDGQTVSGSTRGTCMASRTCDSYAANGRVGQPCSAGPTSAFFGGIVCDCSTSYDNKGYNNNTCVGWSSSKEGICQCTPTAGNCSQDGQSDGCGGTISSSCPPSQVCYQAACCTPMTCTGTPGAPGSSCGNFSNSCGGTLACISCSTANNFANNVCNTTSHKCECVPRNQAYCTQTNSTGIISDGCGGSFNCAS